MRIFGGELGAWSGGRGAGGMELGAGGGRRGAADLIGVANLPGRFEGRRRIDGGVAPSLRFNRCSESSRKIRGRAVDRRRRGSVATV